MTEAKDIKASSDAFRYDSLPAPSVRMQSIDDLLLFREIEEFLYYEADLLDQWRYREWLDLVAEDIRYWMPIRRNVKYGDWSRERTNELHDLAWFDESKQTLSLRVEQLESGVHWAEEPLSRISHMVSNVRIVDRDPHADARTVRVQSRFMVYRNHQEDEETLLVGKRDDVFVNSGGNWQLSRRMILVDQSVLLAKNLTFLI